MTKYRIVLSPPKFKRLSSKVIVTTDKEQIFDLDDKTTFEFDVPEDISWEYGPNKGKVFKVKVIYTGKNKEVVVLPVPEKI